jgi:hypothetical protein
VITSRTPKTPGGLRWWDRWNRTLFPYLGPPPLGPYDEEPLPPTGQKPCPLCGAVRTGLNNLVRFSTGIWYELDRSATTYRQANGRLHRIGQTRPVTIEAPYYAGTAQEVAFDLLARKVSASLQVDGLDLQAALEAAGASDDHSAAIATAMSLGQAVYQALVGGDGPRAVN